MMYFEFSFFLYNIYLSVWEFNFIEFLRYSNFNENYYC